MHGRPPHPLSTRDRSVTLPNAAQLRLEGNRLASAGNLSAAIDKYRSALTHAPAGTAHKLHSNISLAALGAGQTANAIAAAHEALKVAPADFTTVRDAEVLCAAARLFNTGHGYICIPASFTEPAWTAVGCYCMLQSQF